jgi:pilus assembly protein Flp/PilA
VGRWAAPEAFRNIRIPKWGPKFNAHCREKCRCSNGRTARNRVVGPFEHGVEFPYSQVEAYVTMSSIFAYFPECVVSTNGLRLAMAILYRLLLLGETHGQDLIEYALMAGFVAVAAGAAMPGVASSISTIFSKVGSVLKIASTQGS